MSNTTQVTETRIRSQQVVLSKGRRHVSIWTQGDDVTATLFINSEDFFQSTITMERWQGRTEAGARKWAMKKLA